LLRETNISTPFRRHMPEPRTPMHENISLFGISDFDLLIGTERPNTLPKQGRMRLSRGRGKSKLNLSL
jgi:hypothetical protein